MTGINNMKAVGTEAYQPVTAKKPTVEKKSFLASVKDKIDIGGSGKENYTPGKLLKRVAVGAAVGALAIAISGGGILATAGVCAAVSGIIGGVTGAVLGSIGGLITDGGGGENIARGAAVGAVALGGISTFKGALKGAAIGAISGFVGGGPLGGAIANGLLSAII